MSIACRLTSIFAGLLGPTAFSLYIMNEGIKLMMRLLIFLWLLVFGSAAFAAERIALVGGTLVDGTLREPIRNSVILVEGERIVAVGTVASLPVPDGTQVISTEGMTVLPGLWDMHVHLMLNGHADYAHWDRTYLPQLRDVIMPASAKQLLMAGVTGARDLGAPLEDSIAVRDAIRAAAFQAQRCSSPAPSFKKRLTPAPRRSAGASARRPMREPRCAELPLPVSMS